MKLNTFRKGLLSSGIVNRLLLQCLLPLSRSLNFNKHVFAGSLRYSFRFKKRATAHNWIESGFIYLINVIRLGLYCIQQPPGNIFGVIYNVLLSSVWLITGTTVAKLTYESVFANKRNNGWIALSNIRYILNKNLLFKAKCVVKHMILQ